MARFLITGGCGFIGSHLSDALLADGHEVLILDDLSRGTRERVSSACELVIGDVTEPETVRGCLEDVAGCFHLAAVPAGRYAEQWGHAHRVNLSGTVTVLEAARKRRVPVVFASSSAVYGDNADIPLCEAASTRPHTTEGADKLGAELHARVATLVHGVPTVGLRLFSVYGPRTADAVPSGVMDAFVARAVAGKPLVINGDGEQVRDFVYVADAVAFFREAMARAGRVPLIANLCSGSPVTINHLARIVKAVAGTDAPVIHQPSRPGDIRTSVGDPRLAERLFGLKAGVPLVGGLRAMLDGDMPFRGPAAGVSGGGVSLPVPRPVSSGK